MTAKDNETKLRRKLRSMATMLSRARGEARDAEAALAAVLQTIEGTDHDQKARQAAEEAVTQARRERPDEDGDAAADHARTAADSNAPDVESTAAELAAAEQEV